MTAAAPDVSVEAPAKINLFLHVTGRRPDGYHELESLVAFAEIHDRIDVRSGEGLTLEIEGPFAAALDAGGENLAIAAARALAAEAGIRPDARIRLHKALPVAAGIGGGSADAAAALRALCVLWNGCRSRRTGSARSRSRSARTCRSASPGGRASCAASASGSRPRRPCPRRRRCWSTPMVPLPTAGVFAAREGPFSAPVPFDTAPADAAGLAAALSETRNDLFPPARRLCPEIDAVLDAIRSAPSCLLARLSGSGPTCFGLFPSEKAASEAVRRIAADRPGWWVCATRLLASPGAGVVAGPND